MSSFLRNLYRQGRAYLSTALFYIFRIFPLQNKIVITTFRGKKYGDNSQYILEKLHEIDPKIRIIWQTDTKFHYTLPPYVKAIPFYSAFQKSYHMATAKVWVDTHRIEAHIRKRKGQLFIETWHGGLGIKKIQQDVANISQSQWQLQEIKNTCKLADIFISNSKHLTDIYRKAFHYNGKIWRCGYPKNDILIQKNPGIYQKIRHFFHLNSSEKIFLYAPTFRDTPNKNLFDIDWTQIKQVLDESWGGSWTIFVRWHPSMTNDMNSIDQKYRDIVQNVTCYPDMQELLLSADAFLSDYSSGIFDGALRKIPCFTYAPDYEKYKEEHGVYYELSSLPFPFAENFSQLLHNLRQSKNSFDQSAWQAFTQRTELYESGHASQDIAKLIHDFMQGNTQKLNQIQSD